MDYDFFDKEEETKKEENTVERNPALPKSSVERNPNLPKSAEEPSGGGRKKVKWGKVVLSVALAAMVFLCGMLTMWISLDAEIRTLLTVKKRIQNDYYQEVSDEDFYRAIFGGINENLLDPYSGYMTPEEFAAMISDMEGNRIGLGLVFSAAETDGLRITRVCGNSPAEAAGIVAGERIIGVGKTESEITACQTFDDFSTALAGYGEEEEFCLQLQSGESVRVVRVYKAAYVENYVFYRTNEKAYTFTGEDASVLTEKGAPLTCLDNDTAYIRLIQFTGNATAEFSMAMEQFKRDGKKNLVLDLRENGGGYLDVMQAIASYFCKNATEARPVVAVADYGDQRVSYKANGNYYYSYFTEESRICVLADGYSASASECLIGCMLDYGAIGYGDICLAERDGVAKTYGKGIMQETTYVNLIKQDAITLTTAEIRWPVSDNSIHGRGVLPEDGALTVEENTDYEKETENAIEKLLG